MELIFEWDRKKAKSNLQKHGIDFDEAQTIFFDPLLYTFRDDFHSDLEDRYISLGISSKKRTLLVVHTEVDKSSKEIIIRIISSRKATKREREIYEREK